MANLKKKSKKAPHKRRTSKIGHAESGSNNNLLIGGLILGAAVLYYYKDSLFGTKHTGGTPPGGTALPPGHSAYGVTNNSDTALYISAAGQILNSLGQVVSTISHIVQNKNTGSNSNGLSYDPNTYSPNIITPEQDYQNFLANNPDQEGLTIEEYQAGDYF